MLRAGQNQIRIIENGFHLEIKCFLNNSGEINLDGSYTYGCLYEGECTISKERFEFITNMLAEVENTYKQNGNSHPWTGRD